MNERIVVDPRICSGKPVIRGTRIMVKNILGLVAGGYTPERIVETYPELTMQDVSAALQYAAEITNSVIELHDSKVASIRQVDRSVVCDFAEAYTHKSVGRPGYDAGTGWVQPVQLVFEDAELSGDLPEFPDTIWQGEFRLNGADQHGMIPVPFLNCLESQMDLKFDEVHSVSIRGKTTSLRLVGEARFVEEFPGLAGSPSAES